MSDEIINCSMCVVFILLLAAAFMLASERDDLKKQAVEHGYAEWVVKPNGDTTWQWKEAAK